jgi:hypothetical protein
MSLQQFFFELIHKTNQNQFECIIAKIDQLIKIISLPAIDQLADLDDCRQYIYPMNRDNLDVVGKNNHRDI